MPSEDSLAEPVPTSHFTGQQGQRPRMGLDPLLLFILFLPVITAVSRLSIPSRCQAPGGHWGYTEINPFLPSEGTCSSSPKPRGGGQGRQGQLSLLGLERP